MQSFYERRLGRQVYLPMRHTGILRISRRCWTECDRRASRSWLRRLKRRWRSVAQDAIRRRLRERVYVPWEWRILNSR